MLEDCVCEGGVDISESNADHFVCLLVLWNLVDEAVGEALCKRGELLLVEPEQEGEEDVRQIDVEFSLLALRSLQTDRHRLQIIQHCGQRILYKGLNLRQVHLLFSQIQESSEYQLNDIQIVGHS